jgi:hypothetical protein
LFIFTRNAYKVAAYAYIHIHTPPPPPPPPHDPPTHPNKNRTHRSRKQPEPQSQHYTIGIRKLNLQNWKSYSTDDTKFIHGTITRKKLLGVEEGRVGAYEYMFKPDGADAAVVLEIWIRILTKDTTSKFNTQQTTHRRLF